MTKPRKRAKTQASRGSRKGPSGRAKGRISSHRHTAKYPLWKKLLAAVLILFLAGPPLVLLLYRFVPPPVTPLMLIRLAEGEGLDYRWQPIEAISPQLPRAVIAAEDNRFCEHWGFDFTELGNTVDDWFAGERVRGASTISMQTTKNLLLWPQRQMVRKLLEAWLTWQLEFLWPKSRIIEVYLNVIEMGPGIYGAEAAEGLYPTVVRYDLTPRADRP